MMLDTIDQTGFAPRRQTRARGRRATVVAQFIASVALALSIAIAITAVSIGIAHAGALAAADDDPNARVAAAILFALVLVGIGGLTALLSRGEANPGE